MSHIPFVISKFLGTNIKATLKAEFAGIINESILNPCFFIPIKFIPIKIEKDKVKVIIIWLVTVKLYGIKPLKLLNKINKKIIETYGKYFSPLIFTLSNNNCKTVS